MHRDMTLVREVLERIASGPEEIHSAMLVEALPDFAEANVLYHLHILIQAGLVAGTTHRGMSDRYASARFISLTWAGNELRDTLKDPAVWKKTESGLAKVGSWSLDLVSGLAKAYAKEMALEKLGIKLD